MRKGPILVVEDVPNVLELLELTLRFKGYDVVGARDGLEGLDLVEKNSPALIITDILMPRLDGYAFIQNLRTSDSVSSQIPVIFLSATYVTSEDKSFALSLGGTRFIEKPIDTEDFLLTIAEIMAEDTPNLVEPMKIEDFYKGYRERLEQKLHHKNTQISRTERLIPTLHEDQRQAFETMLQLALNDRETIQTELQDITNKLENFKVSGK